MRSTRSALLVLAVTVAATASRPSAQSLPSAADLAARIQARYDTIRDFTADFTQMQTSALVRKTAQDRGKVTIKKPGRMRWVLETNSRHQVISDGVRLYSYLPKERTVQQRALSNDDQTKSALFVLTGRGNLTRDFVPSGPVEARASEWRLTLKPKTAQPDVDTLTLVVDRTSLELRGLVVVDAQGSIQSFQFANLKENRGVPDSAFEFTIPPGVEVVE